MVRSDGEIAKCREHVAAANRKAVDPGDHRFRHVADQSLDFVDRQSNHATAVILAFMRGLIAAGAECLLARTGQDDACDLSVVSGGVEGLDELFERLAAAAV